ncbi:MAG TPA: helix-turn-helix domain-containing protein [Halothiobacillus sp.]|nr:helix-turn-helix domain-containing protein [Halothiobacillus sp.]
MTPTDFRTIRAGLGMTQGGLASALGVSRRIVQYWESGERPIPETVARLMRLAASDAEILPRLKAA